MQIEAPGIVVAARAHGEHGAIVRVMTERHGLIAGYVRGGRSRRMRPVLQPGNLVAALFRARSEAQLAALTLDLLHGRAALMAEPLAAAAIEWTTALVAATLPEGQPYPRVHAALDGVLIAIESAAAARGWLSALARFEQVVLAELGFGVDDQELSADPLATLEENRARLAGDLLTDWRQLILPARGRLVDRIARAVA